MTQLFDLTGKVAVITGSSRGIGRAIAEAMADHGARVVISSRKQDACEAVAAAINAKHPGAATAKTFLDGWVVTGDIGRIDEEGFLFLLDRAKDMLIRGGENIYSSEVENALYDHPAVTDAAVIGIPHRTLGEEPAAVVHLAPGSSASEPELQDWVRARIAAFKVPVRIVFMAETLPRNANGKILKKELGPLFEEQA